MRRGRAKPEVGQLPLWQPASAWRAPRLGDLPSWEGARRVGVDLETRDEQLNQLGPGVRRRGCYVTGFSFALEDGPAHYVPLRHQGGDNVEDPEAAWRYLRDQARHFRGVVAGANLSYELDWLLENGVDFPRAAFFRDVQVADPLICELHRSYSLEAIAGRWGLPGKDEALLREAARDYAIPDGKVKHNMWRLPARFVGPYGEQDARLPLAILRRQEREIEGQDLQEVYDLESRVLPVLVHMRRRGVRIDQDRLAAIEAWSLAQEAAALDRVHALTGVRVGVGDVWKTEVMAPALQALGIRVPTAMVKGQRRLSIDKEFLAGIDHEVGTQLLWARKANKLRTTFAASIREHMVRGRVHCTFNQLRRTKEDGGSVGAAYGRLSSENPNMQQQPARDEFAKMWRSIYLPEQGAQFGALDYSQQEPRWLVHFSELCGLEGATAAAQRYRDDPRTDNHQMMADLTGLPRKQAKELLLGKCYGMGGAKLSRKLGLPTRWAVFYNRDDPRPTTHFELSVDALAHAAETGGRAFEVAGEEGQAIINQFDERLPFVRKLARLAQRQAERRGYIRTISGRRCRFPQREDGTYDWCHKALNRLIQGSSACQTKSAVVQLHAAGCFVQLQVHDEIDGSFSGREEAEAAAEIMRNCCPARVPFQVDVELGPSWGEAR